MHHITADSTLARAHLLMRRLEMKRLPVVVDGRVVGVISENDIHQAIGLREQSTHLPPLIVGNFMMSPVKVIESAGQLDIPAVIQMLLEESATRAFVIAKEGKSQNILFREELLTLFRGSDGYTGPQSPPP